MPTRRRLLAAGGLGAVGLAGGYTYVRDLCRGTGGEVDSTDPLMQSGYDARNSGVAASPAPAAVSTRWSTRLDPIEGGLAASGDRIVVATAGELVGLERATGERLWRTSLGEDVGGQPAVTADAAYVPLWNGGDWSCRGVAAVDVRDGTTLWRAIPDLDVDAAPTVAEGVLYATGAGRNDRLVAIEAETGDELWRARPGTRAPTPAVADGTAYVGGGERHAVFALDAETGEQLWRRDTTAEVSAPPAVVDDTVYVSSMDGTLHALATSNGDPTWTRGIADRAIRAPAATRDVVYAPTGTSLVALAPDGSERWSRDDLDTPFSPTIAGEKLVFSDEDVVHCLDAATGERLWDRSVPNRNIDDMAFSGIQSPAMVADGEVYVAAHGGDVIALEAAE